EGAVLAARVGLLAHGRLARALERGRVALHGRLEHAVAPGREPVLLLRGVHDLTPAERGGGRARAADQHEGGEQRQALRHDGLHWTPGERTIGEAGKSSRCRASSALPARRTGFSGWHTKRSTMVITSRQPTRTIMTLTVSSLITRLKTTMPCLLFLTTNSS